MSVKPKKNKKTFVKGVGEVEEENPLTKEERKLEAEWYFCQNLMKDMNWSTDSKQIWLEVKDTYLQGKVSWETWKRYFKENPIEENKIDNLSKKIEATFNKKELAVLSFNMDFYFFF